MHIKLHFKAVLCQYGIIKHCRISQRKSKCCVTADTESGHQQQSPGQEIIQTLGLQNSVYVNIRDTRVLALSREWALKPAL